MSQFTKQALSLKHAYVAALLATSAVMAAAQPASPSGGPGMGMGGGMGQQMGQGMGQGTGQSMGMHQMGQRDPAKMQAMMAKRQEELKAKLKLAPEQDAAWTTYAAAVKPSTDKAMVRPDRAEMAKLSTPERIDKMRAMHTERHAAMTVQMDKRAEATKAFYATLNPEQKKVFDAESFKGAGRGHGQMHHQRG